MQAWGPEFGAPETTQKPNVYNPSIPLARWETEIGESPGNWPIVLTTEANKSDSAPDEVDGEDMSRSSSNLHALDIACASSHTETHVKLPYTQTNI